MRWFRRAKRQNDATEWERSQREVRSSKEHRYAQTVTQRGLVNEVSKILFAADPIGINFDTNTDEYDSEAETIVIALGDANGPAEVQALTHETFAQWFGPHLAGPVERYAGVATDIWDLWQRRGGQRGLGPR